MSIFFEEIKKSYIKEDLSNGINLINFYHEFFIQILCSNLIPENKKFSLKGNIFLDFENQDILNFFQKITQILVLGSHHGKNLKLYYEIKNFLFESQNNKNNGIEFQKFIKSLQKKFNSENQRLLKELKKFFNDKSSKRLDDFFASELRNEIYFEEYKIKDVNDSLKESLFLSNFYLKARNGILTKILLKIQNRSNHFKIGFRKILGNSNQNESNALLFKKYFTPYGMIFDSEKEKDKRFSTIRTYEKKENNNNNNNQFTISTNTNENHFLNLKTRREIFDNYEENICYFLRDGKENKTGIAIKFYPGFFNLINSQDEIKNYKIQKNEENEKFIKDVFLNLFILGNIDVVLFNILIKINENKEICDLKLIDFEMGIDFKSIQIGTSRAFVEDNQDFFFNEKNLLGINERTSQFFSLFAIRTFKRILPFKIWKIKLPSPMKSSSLSSILFYNDLFEKFFFKESNLIFKNFFKEYTDYEIIVFFEEILSRFENNLEKIKDAKIKTLLNERKFELKIYIDNLKKSREDLFKKIKNKLEKIEGVDFYLKIKKNLKKINKDQLGILFKIKNFKSNNNDDEKNQLIDEFIRKNSYIYINSQKQKFLRFLANSVFYIILALILIIIFDFVLILLKIANFTKILFKLFFEIFNTIENWFSKSNLLKFKNFFEFELKISAPLILLGSCCLFLIFFCLIEIILYKVMEIKIFDENKELGNFFEIDSVNTKENESGFNLTW